MGVAAEPRPFGHPLPGGQSGATVRLHPLLAAEAHSSRGLYDRPPGRLALPRTLLSSRADWIWAPIPAFLVEHPGAGPMLIDTGIHASVEVDPKGNLGAALARFSDLRGIDGGIPERLAERGYAPSDVHTVVMTHLHFDHASGVVEFPNATFVVDEREWAAASNGSVLQGYRAAVFDHAFDWRTIDFDADYVNGLSPFGRSVDLFGDGSVRLLSTPGHTLGHQSVLLRLRGRDALVCGDAAYLRRTIDEDGVDPLLVTDEHLFQRSLKEIKRFVEREPEALVIPGHDVDVWPTLDAVYE